MPKEYYKGLNGKKVKMTPAEVEAMLAEQVAQAPAEQHRIAAEERAHAKRAEMIGKGWVDVEAFLDDMAERGADVVLQERRVINNKHKER